MTDFSVNLYNTLIPAVTFSNDQSTNIDCFISYIQEFSHNSLPKSPIQTSPLSPIDLSFTPVDLSPLDLITTPNSEIPLNPKVQLIECRLVPEGIRKRDSKIEDQKSSRTKKMKGKPNPKNIWLTGDDEILYNLAIKYKSDWKKISKRLKKLIKKTRSVNFLKNRYRELSNPLGEKWIKFTHEEDLKIAKFYKIYPGNWQKIAENFNNRNPIMLKNRYYSYIFKKGLIETLIRENENFEQKIQEDSQIKDIRIGADCQALIEKPANFSEIPLFSTNEFNENYLFDSQEDEIFI